MSEHESADDVGKMDTGEGSCNAAAAKTAAALQVSGEGTARAPTAFHTSTKASAALPDENNNPSPQTPESLQEEPARPSSTLSKTTAALAAVSSTLSASVPPVSSVPKMIVSTAPVRSTASLMVGARVVQAPATASMAALQGLGALTSHPGGITVTPSQAGGPTTTPAPAQGPMMTLPRTSTVQQTVTVSRSPQTTSLQLPANFHIPQGMVLIRSDSGQLMLVSQQALAQAQVQGLGPKPTAVSTAVRPQVSQASATATSIIRVSIPPSSSNVTTIIKPAPTTGTGVVKPMSTTGTTIIKPSSMSAGTTIKPTAVLSTTGVRPSSTTGTTVIKATATQKPPSSTSVTSTSVMKSVGKASPSVTQTIRPGGSAPRIISSNIPTKHSTTKSPAPIVVTAETLENVKKCKNFLVTLMKLASSGTRSANMAQNVRGLVKDLLDGQLEAEEFTEKLYMELKSSPQPYLVPFLKRSLPAVRQLTPNSQLFIQQCDQPKPPSTTTTTSSALSSTSQKHSVPSSTVSQPLRCSVSVRPTPPVIQQSKGTSVKQSVISSSRADLAVQKPKQLVIQTNTQPAGAFGKQDSLQASKAPSSVPPPATRTRSFKDSTPGSFRDDDDINDVASMAGVNLSEENARILASSAELVGSVVHSCRDEPFLQTTTLQQRVLHIGSSHGVVEVNPDVLGLLSHATQERLRDLLEKLSAVAQHRVISYKDDWRHIQTTDTRSQLKFLEQLEKVERRRREEEERETLLCIAKSRSSSEDPEQLRLKQRAKEMQQLELAQMQHREANLAALAALGPRKRKPLEASGPGVTQAMSLYAQRAGQRAPVRVTFRDLIFCMEQDPTLRHSCILYNAYLR